MGLLGRLRAHFAWRRRLINLGYCRRCLTEQAKRGGLCDECLTW